MVLKRGFLTWRPLRRHLKKSLISRVVCIVFASIGFLYLFTANPKTAQWLRDHFFEKSVFMLSWAEKPLQSWAQIKVRFKEHLYIYKNFDHLQNSLELVRILSNKNAVLEFENKKLNTLLTIQETPQQGMLTVPCIGTKVISQRQVLFIRAGSQEGVKLKQPVFYKDQLIGQIDRVTNHASRVLLITDEKSRIPVCFSKSEAEGILTGDGNGNLIIAYCNTLSPIAIGEEVFTSGRDGVFPAHKYIGQVYRIVKENIYIKQGINFNKSLYLQIQVNHLWQELTEMFKEEN
jgi:rod shape-determining protein MreC